MGVTRMESGATEIIIKLRYWPLHLGARVEDKIRVEFRVEIAERLQPKEAWNTVRPASALWHKYDSETGVIGHVWEYHMICA